MLHEAGVKQSDFLGKNAMKYLLGGTSSSMFCLCGHHGNYTSSIFRVESDTVEDALEVTNDLCDGPGNTCAECIEIFLYSYVTSCKDFI